MAQVLVTEQYLEDIADAIREKNSSENEYTPAQMAGAIEALPDAPVLVQKSITANGSYDPDDDSADGYSGVTINVPNTYTASDEGKVVDSGALVAQGSDTVTENDTYDTTLISSLTVNVEGGGGSVNILSGTDEPTASIGNDGAIYLKYLEGEDLFGTPTSDNPENGTISATSTYSAYSPFKAFGENIGWGASGGNGTLTYSFTSGSFQPVALSFIDYFDVSGGYLKADTFTFEGSNDGTNWDILYTKSDPAGEKEQEKTVIIETQNSYSKFRFVVNGGSGYAGIKKVVCTGASSGSVAPKTIKSTYLKVNGAWQSLIGSDIDDVNTGSES